MFAAGSIKSSKWGWDVKRYPQFYGETALSPASTVGYFSGGCLAPNGLIYVLPALTGIQKVYVINPGKSNTKTSKWQAATITTIPAGTGNGKQPLLPDYVNSLGSQQRRFQSKGILAPNGLIYFFGVFADGYVVINPATNPSNILNTTEWKVVTYTSIGLAPGAGITSTAYYGGVLHNDGKIYLLPTRVGLKGSNSPIVRITPRSSSLDTSDTIDISGYWTGGATNSTKRYMTVTSTGAFMAPADITGSAITPPSDTSLPYVDSATSLLPIGDAISHPDGNLYIFGGYRNPYILKLNTNQWSNTGTLGAAVFYADNNLRIPNVNPTTYGIRGAFFSGSLEKLKPGQDPSTLKIYFTYGGAPTLSNPGLISNDYAKTIVFDPSDGSFANVGDIVNQSGVQVAFNMLPGIKMANGHVFCLSHNVSPTITNPYGQLIVTEDNNPKVIGPQSRATILSAIENAALKNTYFESIMLNCNMADNALYGDKLGKTIVTAANGCFEITSVKGFYPGIRYFSYNNNINRSFTSAPSTHTGVTIVSKNQIKLLGVDLVSSLPVGSKFTLSNTTSGLNDGVYTITARSLSGSDTLITVSGTSLFPTFSTFIEGINFTSATELIVNGFYPELNANGIKIYISDSELGNDDYYINTGYLYTSPDLKLTYSTASFNTGVDATARLYYKDPVNDATAVFTYGQLVEFPVGGDTLRIYGVDLSNSMYNVNTVLISGSSVSGNNGLKTRYDYQNTPPYYDEAGNYSEIIFSPGTFTQLDIESGTTMEFEYQFNDGNVYEIPSDLNTLQTSLWNSYYNKPR